MHQKFIPILHPALASKNTPHPSKYEPSNYPMEETDPSLPPLSPFQTEGPPIQYSRVNHFSSLSLSEINNELDCELAALSKPWKESIPMSSTNVMSLQVIPLTHFHKTLKYVIIWTLKNTQSKVYASALRNIHLHFMAK